MNIHFHPTFPPVTIANDHLPHPGLENNSFILRWALGDPERVRRLCREMGMSAAAVSADIRAPAGKRRAMRRIPDRGLATGRTDAEYDELMASWDRAILRDLPPPAGLPPSMNRPNLPPAADGA